MSGKIIEAVAAVLVHRDRLLVVTRQPYLKAFPGYTAFPGGKIEHDDADHAPIEETWHGFPASHMGALVRECEEELGLSLDQLAQSGQVSRLDLIGEATTPPLQPIRFKTYFYRLELIDEPDLTVAEDELADAKWLDGAASRALSERGQLLAVPPVAALIHQLAVDPSRDDIEPIDFQYDTERQVPCLPVVKDLWMLPVRSHTAPPADRTNAFVIGGYLVDPSPKDAEELERLLTTLERFELHGLLLTHHHPDHHQFAQTIARRLALPMKMSEDTYQRIGAKWGSDHFEGIEIKFVREGERLTDWLGKPVRVYEIPGHDAGQIGLAPDGMAWFLVGDLIQGIGTVVIAPPEGDMAAYFATLERVIELDPKIIMPSHGLAMGTVYRLQATLAHRRQREEQVLSLARAGTGREAMLDVIYDGLDPRLVPFALMNIDSHLTKLKADGRLDEAGTA